METSHYFRNEIFINQIKKTHLDKTDESEYLREKINIILEEDDEKETFNNYLKPYKSLRYLKTIFSLKIFYHREVLLNFCFLQIQTEINTKTVEKFEKNRKFPNFETEFGVNSNWIEKYGKTLNFQFWFKRDYFRNF